MEGQLSKVIKTLTSPKLNSTDRYSIWHTLYKSSVWYSIVILSNQNEDIHKWANRFLYRGVKHLLHLKGNPATEKVFGAAFGHPEGIMDLEIRTKAARLLLKEHRGDRDYQNKKLGDLFNDLSDENLYI